MRAAMGRSLEEAEIERDWTGNAKRLSQADRATIERLIWSGSTFTPAAAGCSAKSMQRFLAATAV